jgi:hypothetical protein
MVTPTEALSEITARQRDSKISKQHRFVLSVLFLLCQNAVARYKRVKELDARVRVLESKMRDIHPDLH